MQMKFFAESHCDSLHSLLSIVASFPFPQSTQTSRTFSSPPLQRCKTTTELSSDTRPLFPFTVPANSPNLQHDSEKLQLFVDGPEEPLNRLQHQWTKEIGADLGPIWKALDRVKSSRSSPQPTTSAPPSLAANCSRRTGMGTVNYAPVAESSDEKAISSNRGRILQATVDEKELQSENHVVTLARAVIGHISAYSQPLVANNGLEFREEETMQLGKP